MIFGRSNQQQAQNAQAAQGAANPAEGGFAPGAQQPSSWTGAGYPTQPSGTGYAGYTPGAGQQPSGQTGYSAAWGGYPQAQQSYAQGGQNYPQMGQGYAQGGQSYPPQGQGGYSQAPAYGQGAQTGSYGQQPYSQGYGASPQGYAAYPQGAPQGGYTYPQMNAAQYGRQTGYNPPQQTGYNAAQQPGYSQGGYNNAYAQMGRNQPQAQQGAPQDFSRQIPLNGGGYVPPAVPVRKQPFEFKSWMLIALGAALAVLFAAGLLAPGASVLKWIFIVLAAGSVLFFWIRPLVSGNRRLCYTIIFGVLCLVALSSALGWPAPRDSVTPSPQDTQEPVQVSSGVSASSAVIDPQTGSVISAVTQAEETPTPAPAEDHETADRLESFFRYWSTNRYDEMLTLCAPSWQSGVDNPKTALFGLMANRTPLDYTVEKISGTVDDTSRTVTVVSTMDRNNGKEPVKYRLGVLMIREGDQWFVDPQSLKTYEAADTPDPSITDTPAPTEELQATANTILYYNPDGGTKYHLDQNCKSTHAKYLPMKGHFTYGEINDDAYTKLTPCNVCGAPLRP